MLDRDITNNLIAVSLTESKMTGYIRNKLVFFFYWTSSDWIGKYKKEADNFDKIKVTLYFL